MRNLEKALSENAQWLLGGTDIVPLIIDKAEAGDAFCTLLHGILSRDDTPKKHKALAFKAAADAASLIIETTGGTRASINLADSLSEFARNREEAQMAVNTAVHVMPYLVEHFNMNDARRMTMHLVNNSTTGRMPSVLTSSFMCAVTTQGQPTWFVDERHQGAVSVYAAYKIGSLDDLRNWRGRTKVPTAEQEQQNKKEMRHAAMFENVVTGRMSPLEAAQAIRNLDGTYYMTLEA